MPSIHATILHTRFHGFLPSRPYKSLTKTGLSDDRKRHATSGRRKPACLAECLEWTAYSSRSTKWTTACKMSFLLR